jgi:hypothetical protein
LIRRDGLTVLVDAGGGNDKERARPHFHRRSWPWLETLRYAGVAPEDIDVVLSAICPASRKPVQVADLRESRAYLDGDPLPVAAVDVAGIRTFTRGRIRTQKCRRKLSH